jgi:hypothetical protein
MGRVDGKSARVRAELAVVGVVVVMENSGNKTSRLGSESWLNVCHVPEFPFPVFCATAHYGSYWWSLRWPRTFVNALRSQNGGNSDATAVPRFFKILKVCYSRLYFLYFYMVAFKLGPVENLLTLHANVWKNL